MAEGALPALITRHGREAHPDVPQWPTRDAPLHERLHGDSGRFQHKRRRLGLPFERVGFAAIISILVFER